MSKLNTAGPPSATGGLAQKFAQAMNSLGRTVLPDRRTIVIPSAWDEIMEAALGQAVKTAQGQFGEAPLGHELPLYLEFGDGSKLRIDNPKQMKFAATAVAL